MGKVIPFRRPEQPAVSHPEMVWIAGGRFRMGSGRHYAEEAPAHPVETSTSHVGFRCVRRTPRA